MLVNKISPCIYEVSMTSEEEHHLRIITVETDNAFVVDVSSLMAFVLTWTEQHWYNAVKEPPTVPLDQPFKDPEDGHSGTTSDVRNRPDKKL